MNSQRSSLESLHVSSSSIMISSIGSGSSSYNSSKQAIVPSPNKKSFCLFPYIEKKIKTLATLVPDEIIYWESMKVAGKQQIYNGVLFFADVSGFTDLCERFTKSGKGGASRVTKVLNEYIGAMVQEIMSHNGDILKFSGDAFLALWKIKDYSSSMADIVHEAIDCALGIQKSHGQYETDVGITLRVKIAIATGQIIFLVIGDSNFMVLGSAVFEIKDVGNICNAGEIIITPAIKMLLNTNHYILQTIPGIPFIKVLGIGSDWSPSNLSDKQDLFDFLPDSTTTEILSEDESETSFEEEQNVATYVLRPSIEYAVQMNLENYLQKFIIPPVLSAVKLGEALENLTEMRQVVIVFINVVTRVFNIRQLDYLVEDAYNKVCEAVSATGGCVNKISMFDKDLMFLIIYGLRGFKHKLQAQQALYCAKSIREQLLRLNQVVCASIGVTSGATYCGVVGHPMRKEYTVIGRTVNKAARLMIAYPDMVSCDRQTFLESHLQSRYFTLQPTRYLKGFSNVGPIYKFDDDYRDEHNMEKELLKTNTYPILDRKRELAAFFGLLHRKTPDHSAISLLDRQLCYHDYHIDIGIENNLNYDFLMIEGAPRWGKSRILNEITYYVKNEIPHYNCTLNKNSRKYKVLRCIFCDGCKISNVKDIKTRTKYVWRTMSPFRVPQFLCALNDLLYLSFDVTPPYLRLSEEEIFFVKQKLIKYLSLRIFKTVSLVTIDNIEFMDGETWLLYKEIICSEKIFTCATINTNANLPEESEKILGSIGCVKLTLLPIAESYHGALICQFLNVKGISLELENFVQKHSMGNPGWIDSFLLTLRHSSILKKVDMERCHAYNDGYVLPEIEYLRRADIRTHQGSKSYFIFEETQIFSTHTNIFNMAIEGWDIYEQIVPEASDEHSHSDLTSICKLSHKFVLEQLDTEDQVDVLMLRTYDSLNVHEQHVLKCSSVIGDEFTRAQLEYVIQSNDIKIATAIQKLFEIKVFGCLRAVYNEGDIIIRHNRNDPNLEQEVKCECEDFPNDYEFHALPKHANCHYLCFREPAFRQMCSNLLTETQANLYHLRAVWYLESQIRRCRSCGLEYFSNINGQKNDDGMNVYSIKVFPEYACSSINMIDMPDRLASASMDSEWSFIREELTNMQATHQIQFRTFLDTNLKECNCGNILKTMYSEILDHYQEIGRFECLLNSLLEYAVLCISRNNYTVAVTLISNASSLLDDTLQYIYPEPAWQVPMTRGRILTLKGALHMRRAAASSVAERSLLQALKCYNHTFPKSRFALKAAIKYHEFKQKLIFVYFPDKYIGSADEDTRTLAEQTSRTLSTMYELYITQKKYDKAYLASLWALTEAVRSNTNFHILCTAYCNASIMDCTYSRPSVIRRIEERAIDMCYRKNTRLDIHEVNAVIDMYSAIYRRKTLCENIAKCLWLGAVITQINSPKYGGYYNAKVPFVFLKCICYTYHWSKAIKFVRKTLETMSTTSVKGFRPNPMAVYLLCVQIMYHTTLCIVPLNECKRCFLVKIEPFSDRKLSLLEMQFYISVWIWHLRKEEWQCSVNIYNHVSDTTQWPDMYDPELAYTNCLLLEGLLLLFVRKINLNDLMRSKLLEKFVLFLFKRVRKIVRVLKCLKSRYYLYWAYYNMIHKRSKKVDSLLNTGEAWAERSANYFERDWIRHSRRAWANWPTSAVNDKWIALAKRETILIGDNLNKKDIVFFTLRLPIRSFEC